MKKYKIVILFLLLLSYQRVSSQNEWAPIGAKWYYALNSFTNCASYCYENLLYECKKDTVIGKQLCREIQISFYSCVGDTSYYPSVFTYSKNDSVFYYNYNKGRFSLLYDFSAKKGDTLYFQPPFDIGGIDTVFTETVDSVYFDIIEGIPLKRYVLNSITYVPWQYTFGYMEKLGGLMAFYPQTWCPNNNLELICYTDSTINYHKYTNYNCDNTFFVENQCLESFFSTYSNNTSWKVAYNTPNGLVVDSLYVLDDFNDTIIGDRIYKLIYSKNKQGATNYYITENLKYFTDINLLKGVSLKIFDMNNNISKELANLFRHNGLWDYNINVDSFRYVNGREEIYLDTLLEYNGKTEPLTFIEGIGSNAGLFYLFDGHELSKSYLLCAYKNGELAYTNKLFKGDCDGINTQITKTEFTTKIKIYPNPTCENFTVDFEEPINKITEIKLYNIYNQLVRSISQVNTQQFTININDLKQGLFVIEILTNSNVIYRKKIIKY